MHSRKFFISLFIVVLLVSSYLCIDTTYQTNKEAFLCPIEFDEEKIPVRNDKMGEGEFGAKRKNGRIHMGVDILAPIGRPVMASKSGWAVSRERNTGYGNCVTIFHSLTLKTRYAHLDEIRMGRIKKVRQGEVIGTVGKTGNADYRSMKPHLHFEVRRNNVPQDPMTEGLKCRMY